ncbi:MAG TPA: insulinase family protein [Gemmatimonadaceae bacterium]|nr:insulinase family protein [Gemmatimonadaceae bacterium]
MTPLALAAILATALDPAPAHDPALIIGTLPNGLHYYLRANPMPAHRAELRLVVNAGSVLEDPDQRGFAHFLEHMAFNGTTRFPGHSLLDFVEMSGMQFGADLNAYTTQDETVYMLTLPTDDGTSLNRGLDVLQDWAGGGITIDSAAVAAERGVIMGEWRMRLLDTASQIEQAHDDTVFFHDGHYIDRKPIGDTGLIQTARPGPIRRFYKDWYRPDLMTVVLVGDFDPVTMERQITSRFGTIANPDHPRPRDVPTVPVSNAWTIDVFSGTVLPGAYLLWPQPAEPKDAGVAMSQRLIEDLLAETLNQRLLQIRSHSSRPYITAELVEGRVARPVAFHGVEIIDWPDSLERGIGCVMTELERMAQHGVPAATLAHQKAVVLEQLEHAVRGEAGQSSRAYADAYVQRALTGEGSLLSARQELDLARKILPTISPDVMAKAAQSWRNPVGARVLVNVPAFAHVRVPTRESIQGLIDSIQRSSVPADTAGVASTSPLLAKLPSPGKIVAERYDTLARITEWTLSNGAKVIVKPSRNDPDEVQLRAWGVGGFAMTPDSLFFTPGRLVAKVMTDVGGLGATSHDALSKRMAANGVDPIRVDIGYADQSIQLGGPPRDLETVFQLMYLQFAAPMLDTATLVGWQSLAKYEGPSFSIDNMLSLMLAMGEKRMLPLTNGVAELATVDQLMAVYRNRFGNAANFTFTLVGAASVAQVRPLVERYLASLPSAGRRDSVKGLDIPSYHKTRQTSKTMPTPRALSLLVFDDTLSADSSTFLLQRERLAALTNVLQDRVRVRLRQELGGTYSPIVSSLTYPLPRERYRVEILFDAEPKRLRSLNRELETLLDSVRSHEVSAAEAARASAMLHRRLETHLQDNEYWLTTIGAYARLGIPLDKIINPYPEAQVSPAELLAAAKRFIPDDRFLHLMALPADTIRYAPLDTIE